MMCDRPSNSLWKRRKRGASLYLTPYCRGGMTAAWTFRSTGNPHMDRYLDFQSHHPSHVKRGLVRCRYNRARSITSTQEALQKEECHLTKVLKQNVYPVNFIHSSLTPQQDMVTTQVQLLEEGSSPPLVMLPYTKGASEDIWRICRKFGMKFVFRSGQSLHSVLSKVKDALAIEKQSKVVHRIPCNCGKVYVGETVRRLETRMKEHQDVCQKGTLGKSALAEHHRRTTTPSGRRKPL